MKLEGKLTSGGRPSEAHTPALPKKTNRLGDLAFFKDEELDEKQQVERILKMEPSERTKNPIDKLRSYFATNRFFQQAA